jgi:hypothetical protein
VWLKNHCFKVIRKLFVQFKNSFDTAKVLLNWQKKSICCSKSIVFKKAFLKQSENSALLIPLIFVQFWKKSLLKHFWNKVEIQSEVYPKKHCYWILTENSQLPQKKKVFFSTGYWEFVSTPKIGLSKQASLWKSFLFS